MSPLYERYHRQMILQGFGETAQLALRQAKILVIGAGGLGCPALTYLIAAGVGSVGIMDDDVVSVTNLHRQVLYSQEDVGKMKVEVAKEKLEKLNPGVSIATYAERLSNKQCLQLFPLYDVIIDGTDNFASRYMINDACVLLKKPLIFGAVSRFEGQVAVFNLKQSDGCFSANYRDIFPQPPAAGEVLNCSEAGVLGVLPGVIGSMLAGECIKVITGVGKPLVNCLHVYNAFYNETMQLKVNCHADSAALIPTNVDSFLKTDYVVMCNAILAEVKELSLDDFSNLLAEDEVLVVDVREHHETPLIDGFADFRIPLASLEDHFDEWQDFTVVFVCQTGRRSMHAASMAAKQFSHARVYSLQGGILSWYEKKYNLT